MQLENDIYIYIISKIWKLLLENDIYISPQKYETDAIRKWCIYIYIYIYMSSQKSEKKTMQL